MKPWCGKRAGLVERRKSSPALSTFKGDEFVPDHVEQPQQARIGGIVHAEQNRNFAGCGQQGAEPICGGTSAKIGA